jgi:hypothetical protein
VGFQVLLFSAETGEDLIREMKRIKDAGADTVIVRVFHNRGDRFYPLANPRSEVGVYFQTDHAPVVDDILDDMIEAARINGLSIYAWMTTRYAAYGMDAFGLFQYDFKEKRLIPARGTDLFDDREVERLVGLYQDLVSYDIDGILFQDDLVLKHNEGMGPGAEKLYRKKIVPEDLYRDPYLNDNGTKYYVKEYTDAFWNWSAFKAKRIGVVTKRIIDGVRRKRPDVSFCVNLSYESVLRPDLALAWLSQDIGEFKKAGVDYFCIMTYHRQMMKEKSFSEIEELFPLMDEIVNNAVFMVGKPERVVIKFQVSDWETGSPVPSSELVTLASTVPGLNRVSIAVVPYRNDISLGGIKRVISFTREGEK